MIRVLACGSRNYDDVKRVNRVLREINEERGIACIIQGGYGGADFLAKRWARGQGIPNIEIEAYWQRYGKRAGPLRNGWMLHFGQPELVVAFPGGPGTANMIEQAEGASVEVLRV